jgi:hypothetical protein
MVLHTSSMHRGLNEHTNFERFWTAALTLFKVATNDNWTDVMVACMVGVSCEILLQQHTVQCGSQPDCWIVCYALQATSYLMLLFPLMTIQFS